MDSRPQRTGPRLTAAPARPRHAFRRRQTLGDPLAPNRLVLGDNLPALGWLREELGSVFRCVYLDPPFNTGRRFAEYDDARSPEAWAAFLEERLRAVLPLVAPDGAVFLEIDDTELGAALAVSDAVFGREARVATVTVVRSASTGHKAKNRGPVNVADYLLIYERARGAWRCRPVHRERRGYDRAYSTFLENPDAPLARWRFVSLAEAAACDAGFVGVRAAKATLGSEAFEAHKHAFALSHAAQVVRFAQPRFEAVSHAAQRAILASRARDGVTRLRRPGHPDMILRGGNRVLFLASKTRATRDGLRLVEPLTNVWDDVPFQGIAREGGVTFERNKKPERLIERILLLSTEPGDWVLDPFLGSGTTAAVAEKMGRRWVGVEQQPEMLMTRAVPRLERVIQGADATGVTGEYGHAGGGGFSVYA